jgi:hypothetical protein
MIDEVIANEGASQDVAGAAEIKATIYLGPTIDRLVNHATIFEDGVLPDYLEEEITRVPAIRGMIVPFTECARVEYLRTLPDGRYRMLYDMISGAAKPR